MDDLLLNSTIIFMPVVIGAAAVASVISVALWLLYALDSVLTNLKERR